MPAGTMTLARYYARQAVKADLRAKGKALREIEPNELARAANAYLDQHRDELVRELVQHLEVLHSAGSPDFQPLPLCKCHERNGGTCGNFWLRSREY
jgi:hypothetical protein